MVPPSEKYIGELHACWTFSCPTSDDKALAPMQEAPKFRLQQMPAVEPVRCLKQQCCIITTCYLRLDSSHRSHWELSLEAVTVDHSTQNLLDGSLQAFGLMTRELRRPLSTLVPARRQIGLAQSPLSEPCSRTLRALPVVPGQLFGSAALDSLDRTAQASRTRQQLAGLNRRAPELGPKTSPQTGPEPWRQDWA